MGMLAPTIFQPTYMKTSRATILVLVVATLSIELEANSLA
jgi:hypothetical protein